MAALISKKNAKNAHTDVKIYTKDILDLCVENSSKHVDQILGPKKLSN